MTNKRLKGRELADAVEKCTGTSFSDVKLLEQALTHSSARAEADYQRLEFLGDRVLGLAISEMLFEAFPDAPEGELSVRLNALVNAETLAEITDELGLSPFIRTGNDLRSLAARKQVNMRADVLEAIVAVVYLQNGYDGARDFVRAHWEKRSQAADAARRDPKTVLQEWAHQVSGGAPDYRVEEREGPDHDPLFTIAVHIEGYPAGRGRGRSKREAEQAAATEILVREGVWQTLGGTS
ncbi:ribonuclease III [Chelativorans sp. YIM 93263]|uniref:ribonuclease III n=1 Tax=Chelativorans sp. YIM 93263 TaxID=2906648 RepID=UPI002377D8DB|nr:ribonuclease III [Chelativorans sp. YIM 93263]